MHCQKPLCLNAINCLLGIEALGKGIGLSTGGIRGLCNSGHKKIGNGGTLKLTLSRNPSVSSTIEIIHLGKQDPAKYCSQVNAAIQIRPDIVRSIISNDNDTDTYDPFNQGDVFQTEADSIVDFQESNPFGTY